MKSYQETIDYIYRYITTRKYFKSDPKRLLGLPKYLMKQLGNPQNKLRIIHIAGTSGKGSTSYLISSLLQSQGFKVGLSVSPHITDIRERYQINNQFIPKNEFTRFFGRIIHSIEKTNHSKWGKPSYFVINMAFAFCLFYKKKVDFAVMETGLGGLYDSTNIVRDKNKIAVITKIGIDHQWFLGKNYAEIATQKAGIIHNQNTAITINQKKSVLDVIKKRAKERSAKLYVLNHGSNIKNVSANKFSTIFDFKFQNLNLPKIKLGLIGNYQAENAAEALAALSIASKQYNFEININRVYKALESASFPGRFEVIKIDSRDFVIDGAHNPQKMKTFVRSLIQIYPKKKFDFLLSFSSGKDQLFTISEMLKEIIPHAKHVFVTEFKLVNQDNKHLAVAFIRIKKVLDRLNFKKYSFIVDTDDFLKNKQESNNPLVMTGSLYLISSLYQTIKSLKNDLV